MLLSIHLTLSFLPPAMSIALLSVCFSVAALQIIHWYHLSRLHIYALMYDIYLSLSDLLHPV